jgi:hypothetical protein
MVNAIKSGDTWLDPRSGSLWLDHTEVRPYAPLIWFEDTQEWICQSETEVDGTPLNDLVVVREDGSTVSLKPWTWPEFPYHKASEYRFQQTNISFTRSGYRYFLIGTEELGEVKRYVRPERYWLIEFDPGSDHADPVWCRENWFGSNRLMLLGEDEHPYWVQVEVGGLNLRIVDMLSGETVVDRDVKVTPYTVINNMPVSIVAELFHVYVPPFAVNTDKWPAFMPMMTKEAMREPVVLILDPIGGNLIKINLEIE